MLTWVGAGGSGCPGCPLQRRLCGARGSHLPPSLSSANFPRVPPEPPGGLSRLWASSDTSSPFPSFPSEDAVLLLLLLLRRGSAAASHPPLPPLPPCGGQRRPAGSQPLPPPSFLVLLFYFQAAAPAPWGARGSAAPSPAEEAPGRPPLGAVPSPPPDRCAEQSRGTGGGGTKKGDTPGRELASEGEEHGGRGLSVAAGRVVRGWGRELEMEGENSAPRDAGVTGGVLRQDLRGVDVLRV